MKQITRTLILFTAPEDGKPGENATYTQVLCNIPAIKMSPYNIQEQPAVFNFVTRDGDKTTPFEAYVTLNIYSKSNNILLTIKPDELLNSFRYTIPADSLGLASSIKLSIYSDLTRNNLLSESQVIGIIREQPIPFPRSEDWSDRLVFRNGDVMMLDNIVYMWVNPVSGNSSINPKDDVANNPLATSWTAYQNWPLLCTSMLFARLGLLGSAVFYDDYMFSQYGIKADGSETDNYSDFDPEKLGQSDCPFTPNILFNFKEGTGHWGGGTLWFDIAGFIYSKSRIIEVYRNLKEELGPSPVQDRNIDLKKGTNLDLTTDISNYETLILPIPSSAETVISLRFNRITRIGTSYQLTTPDGFFVSTDGNTVNYKYLYFMKNGIVDIHFIDGKWIVFKKDIFDYETNQNGLLYVDN